MQKNPRASFEEIADVIRSDLKMCGRFEPVHPNRVPQFSSHQDELSTQTWQRLGAENVVIGTVTPQGPNHYRVSFELLDVYKSKAGELRSGELVVQDSSNHVLMNKTFSGVPKQSFRALSHHISDLIYEKLTGIRGAFSTRIAYVMVEPTKQGQRYSLEIADADGFNPVTLMSSKEPIMSPSWSHDGKKLACVSFEKHRAEIYIIDVSTGRRELLSKFPGINGAPAWSPDGSRLALVLSKEGSPKIYLMDLLTRELTQITDGYSIDTEPAWSVDGHHVYFTSNRGGKPQIYRLSVATKQVERITYVGSYNARPMLTPDGRYLVMMHRESGGSQFHIASQDLKTGQVSVLTHARLDESPTLSPNGAMVLYGTQEGDRQILGLVTLDGRGQLRLPAREGSVQEPAWSPFLS
jgi:TolB protein